MTKKEFYSIIAKHMFVAYRTYGTEDSNVIILADTLEEAEEKAKKHFYSTFVTVSRLTEKKEKEGVYII